MHGKLVIRLSGDKRTLDVTSLVPCTGMCMDIEIIIHWNTPVQVYRPCTIPLSHLYKL